MGDFAERIYLEVFRIWMTFRLGGRVMKAKSYISCSAWRIALIAATLSISACDAVNELVDDVANNNTNADVFYYVSLGTSLSVGVQPTSGGVLLPTNDGYADQLFDIIKLDFDATGTQPEELRLIKLGCPGETLDDMINGGSCLYLAGSQLDAAVDFLTDNMGKVHLVTIDMGANDFRNAGCIGVAVDFDCVDTVSGQISVDLATVLTALRNAAGPDTTIVGVNYYNPYLASWLEGPDGPALAMDTADAASILMGFLSTTYGTALMPLADVAAAFQSGEFGIFAPPPNDLLPISVANICTFTYMCDPAPVGPDIHANTAGYSLIAATIEGVLDELAALP